MSEKINRMFASIASRYDLTNDVLSFGLHRLWKRQAISLLNLQVGERVLDLCTGTGDLALIAGTQVAPSGAVVGLDFVPEMIELARTKAAPRNLPVSFVSGDVLKLPFPDSSFDAVSIAFGIRNVDDPLAGLKEIHRVLKPGGRAVVLEFGPVELPVFSILYSVYSTKILPRLGSLLTGNRAAYEYLEESSRNFPAGRRFLRLLHQADLKLLAAQRLMGGIAHIYTGYRR